MKTGLSRLTGVLFLPLFLTVYSCQETQTALPAEDSVDGILDLLDSVSGQVELPAITDPTLTLTDPSSQWVYLQLATPVTPMTVSFLVTNWTFPASGRSVDWYLDGVLVASQTSADPVVIPDIPVGSHKLCGSLVVDGKKAPFCSGTDCVNVNVKRFCSGDKDPICNDGNPCSIDACVFLGGGKYECRYAPVSGCCNSSYDCTCASGKWEVCNPASSKCVPCVNDGDCDDAEECTQDQCSNGTCSNNWIFTNGAKCCSADSPNPNAACNDGLFCTTDYCDIGAGLCVNVPSTDPLCCEKDPDPACDDGNVCTVDGCVKNICRHGPHAAGCCNNDAECDDGNPCTTDMCGVDNTCSYEPNDLVNCCNYHTDCGPGGAWDDNRPETIDYCQANQCQHVIDPQYCDNDAFPVTPDGNVCTDDTCQNNKMTYVNIDGCCNVDADCNDNVFCTQDVCVAGFCQNTAIPPPTCCDTDLDCDDGNPCNLDRCVNRACRYGPDPKLPNCCQVDADCNDNNTCTVEYCNTGISSCERQLVPGQEPKCCWTNIDCDDGNMYTKDICNLNRCDYIDTPTICNEQNQGCNDLDPCTIDACDLAKGLCTHVAKASCCLSDANCAGPLLTDGNPCTVDTCNPSTNQCLFVPITECCLGTSPDECDDGNDCTTDSCVANSCRHVRAYPGCCNVMEDCNDGNECTLDQCDLNTKTCKYTANYDLEGCCLTQQDCNDNQPCTNDVCLNFTCVHTDVMNCCAIDSDCDDNNLCTCDKCIYSTCRNLGPGVAAEGCNLPPICCTTVSDCLPDDNPCTLEGCVNNNCVYTPISPCANALPFTDNFNSCTSFPSGWKLIDLGATSFPNWGCRGLGPLGPDVHVYFNWMPEIEAPFSSILVSPALDASTASIATVQYERLLDIYTDVVDVGIYAISDTADPVGVITEADTFVPLSIESFIFDTEAELASYVIPQQYLSNRLFLGFQLSSSLSYNISAYELDNVRVCAGTKPTFTSVPAEQLVSVGKPQTVSIYSRDTDPNQTVTVSIVEGPAFATVISNSYDTSRSEWRARIKLNPTTNAQAGDYVIRLKVTDGCLEEYVDLNVKVLISSGYLVWQAPGTRASHAQAIADAIIANGRSAQVVQDIYLFSDLTVFDGIFITMGIYGAKHVLTEQEGLLFVEYLRLGGKVYMEGGDTWSNDPATEFHSRFGIVGVDDGVQNYPGPVLGRHFCNGFDFAVTPDFTLNNFLDRIDRDVATPSIPILRGTTGDHAMAVAYQPLYHSYRSIGASVPFAALVDSGTVTKKALMARYLAFFDSGFPPCGSQAECDDSQLCTIDSCGPDGVCVNEVQSNCILCVDDTQCPDLWACRVSSQVCGRIPGDKFDSTDTPITISHSSQQTYQSSIYISEGQLVKDVHVQLKLDHAYSGDLKISLTHMGKTVVLKSNDPTNIDPNHYFTYDFGKTVFSGSVLKLDAFNGLGMVGDWTLTVEDTAPLSGGQLTSWSLYIVYDVPPCSAENPDVCDDMNVCTLDSCDTAAGYCLFEENPCTDIAAGKPNLCTEDSCDPAVGCIHHEKECNDEDVCTLDTCDTVTGECEHPKVANCVKPCTKHSQCGYNDYCDPVTEKCTPIPGQAFQAPGPFPMLVPDDGMNSAVTSISTNASGHVLNLFVKVYLKHPYSGDLTLRLSNGTYTVYLRNQSGGALDDVDAVFGLVEPVDGPGALALFSGASATADWTLEAKDWAVGDAGSIERWSLHFVRSLCFSDNDCDDNNACTVDTCDQFAPGGACVNTVINCDDGSWCNGQESCDPIQGCISGVPPVLSDGIDCTTDLCDEATGTIRHTPQNALCDDGLWCNGAEVCHPVMGCRPGTAPEADDGIFCTTDLCDEVGDTIQHLPNDHFCQNESFCDGEEVCDIVMGCIAGAPLDLDDGIDCTVDVCDDNSDLVVHYPNSELCDDGRWCTGQEFCDVQLGCQQGMPPEVDDGVDCTEDICLDDPPQIINIPNNGACDDGDWCNGIETCSLGSGCVQSTPPRIDDAIDCTEDSCDGGAQLVNNVPMAERCDDGNPCTTDVCVPGVGCQYSYNTDPCDDGELCTVGDQCANGFCVPGGPNTVDVQCIGCNVNGCPDDGNLCNGFLFCDPGTGVCLLAAGSVVNCSDTGNDCTYATCEPGSGACVEQFKAADTFCSDGDPCSGPDRCDGAGSCTTQPNLCDDGIFCNGVESCSPLDGSCIAGVPPVIDDGVACTMDICDEAADEVRHIPNDAQCSDGLFCTGVEACDVDLGCILENVPELDDGFDCTLDYCDETLRAVVHEPRHQLCDDGLYCNGLELCLQGAGCVATDIPDPDDGIECTVDYCDEDLDTVVHEANHASCNDGDDCNGVETCQIWVGCRQGLPPVIDDGVGCTVDLCENGVLSHTPDNSFCDDGLWCNGAETCSATAGCLPGTAPTLTDDVPCTVDYCDEALDIVQHIPDNNVCNNGLFCDGEEYCDLVQGCIVTELPNCDDANPCTVDLCNPALNSGIGACDSTTRIQYCSSTCGGTHPYDAGDNVCGYDDACVGGTAGAGLGNCTPVCNGPYCAKAESGTINALISDSTCITRSLTVVTDKPYINDLNVKLELQHTFIGDLKIQLKTPQGTWVPLWVKGTGGDNDHMYNTFNLSYGSADFCPILGQMASGVYSVEICDESASNTGSLISWKVFVTATDTPMNLGDTCENAVVLDTADGVTAHPGTTRCATNVYSSTCGGGAAAERVYKVTVAQPTKAVFDVLGDFDTILSIRQADGATCAGTALQCKDFYTNVTMTEQLKISLTIPGTYYFIVDGAPSAVGDYVLTTSFLALRADGETCGESDECISGRCNNGFCCSAGTCCALPTNCPASFSHASICSDRATCQGTRKEATCENFQCGSLIIDDDSGCAGEVADDCDCYQPKICTTAVDQLPPVCPTTCSNDSQCSDGCHCGNGCEPNKPNGQPCTKDSNCLSGHCDHNICCDEGFCCNSDLLCPTSLFNVAPSCTSPGTCQGHKMVRSCTNFMCVSVPVDDDSACGPTVPASDCGCYPTVFCTGAIDQAFPVCGSSCTIDSQCDSSCHCDDVCVADVVDGGVCDENSDCVSGYCANGFCCNPGAGDNQCCSNAMACPGAFREEAMCDSSETCQGHRTDATCVNSICGSVVVNDDTACSETTLALECGLFKSKFCKGTSAQTPPVCPDTCTTDADCDDGAHCDGTCVLDLPNGDLCDEDSDCISDHCQNGRCCNSGDCCIASEECPDSYLVAPTCSEPDNCQGFRKDKRCENFMCNNEPIPDDSACTPDVLANECGCYTPKYCSGDLEQPVPECPVACQDDVECDMNCHCEGTCEPNLPLGSPCDEDRDCYSLHCADGVCCDMACGGSCEACNIAGTVGNCLPHSADSDPEDECGLCMVCNGSGACAKVEAGFDPLDHCSAQDPSTCLLDGECNGNGACRFWNSATECADGYCLGSVLYPADKCNGAGQCINATSKNCGSYLCDPDALACRTECTEDSHCSPGFWCNADGSCVAKVNQSLPCGSHLAYGGVGNGSSQCKTGFCADGFCCDKACDGDCMACDKAGLVGFCTNHAPLSDPEDDCALCNVCNGLGACALVVEATDPVDDCAQVPQGECGQDGTCDGAGACRLWIPNTVCVEQGCVPDAGKMTDYQINADLCDGTGSCVDYGFTPCYPYICNGTWGCYSNCSTNAECAADSFCLGAECVLKKENGMPCAGNNWECQSDHCVDGYCCDTACEGECQACNIENFFGVCTGHANDTDPEDDCTLCNVCNGASQCVPVNSGFDPLEECAADNQSTCQLDGACDGAGACRLWLPETVCLAQSCSVNILTFAFECDGLGTCTHQGVMECDPYFCDEGGGDCRSFCSDNAHCVDGFWCNGSQECVAKFELGSTCLHGYQCLSDFCVDGFCCDTACAEDCVSCALAGQEGTCSFHSVNSDPDNDCSVCYVCSGDAPLCVPTPFGTDPVEDCDLHSTNSCGQDGTCDGVGACHLWELNTICIDQFCTDHVKRLADRCDGSGLCTDAGDVDCTPYQCDEGGIDCRTTCSEDSHCLPTHWCDTAISACMPKRPNGEGCDTGNQCVSSFCTDGVCCDVACDGECKACNLAGNVGTCVMYDNDTDPEVECGLCGVCNGAGACKAATDGTDPKSECEKSSESTCGLDGECDGAKACRFWNVSTICVGVSCAGFTKYPEDYCSGDGSCVDSGELSCIPYMCNEAGNDCRSTCTDDVHCTDGYYCGPLGTCVLKKLNGVECGAGRECASDFCVDGVCCNSACDGLCHTCSTGTCTPIEATLDPEFECPSCQVCDGAGACTPVVAGIDPKNNCAQTAESTCGLDGTCDGSGGCRNWLPSTICVEQKCLGFTLHDTDYCSGAGLCVDSGTQDCTPYVCAEDAEHCRTGCTEDAHCQSAFYCLGNVCTAKKPNGDTCAEGRECTSSYCVDGYCCNNACDGDCESCGKPGTLGACTPHAAASDPEDDCPVCQACSGATAQCVNVGAGLDPVEDCAIEAATTCGQDGTCDGSGACRLWLPNTVCLAQFCTDAVVHSPDTCNGTGTCADGGTVSCAPYQCAVDNINCRTFCSADSHCVSGFYCNSSNQCVPKKPVGEECGANNQCVSNFCVDGFCCDTSCTDNCMNCALAGFEGTCKYFANNEDPEDECGLCGVCNGAGLCRPASSGTDPKSNCAAAVTTSCDFDGECDGNYACRFWNTSTECVPQSCNDHVRYPADLCSGGGDCIDSAPVDCEPYVCNTTETDCLYACQGDGDCMSAYWCQGATCVSKKDNGDPCGGGNECVSGFCADGVCCNRACAGTCENCALATTEGTCTRYAPNTDPELECGLCNVCSGSGTCVLVPEGSDPLGQCEASEVDSCQLDGSCDGSGACRLWLPTSICVQQFCQENVEHAPDYCNGTGTCLDSGTTACEPYVCDGDAISCLESCMTDDDCQIAYWCNGNVCEPKFTNGTDCQAGRQCLSGNCIDGYCCNTACGGTCQSCAIVPGVCSAYSSGSDPEDECALCNACNGLGACTLVAAGQDPVGDCETEPESTCNKDGACDGAGACRLWLLDTVCLAQFCDNGVEHANDTCDGLGLCTDGGTTLCHPYVCQDTVDCRESCTADEHCVLTHWCQGGVCVEKRALGEECTASNQCYSNQCVDGYCCNTACNSGCQACDIAGFEGTCTYHSNDTDPEAECDPCQVCNGGGLCKNATDGTDVKLDCTAMPASTCQLDGVCDGAGACRLWNSSTICVNQSCTGSTLYPTDYCSGTGSCIDAGVVSCCPYVCSGADCRNSCTSNEHCCTNAYCSGASCVDKKVDGSACTAAFECASGFCADGFCCNVACTGACRSCALPGQEGTCSNYAGNTDPERECGKCRVCNGAGFCKPADAGTDIWNECSESAPESCGLDGECNGASNCRYWNTATVCVPQSCSVTTLYLADTCSGSGACSDAGTQSCCPYVCNPEGSGCRTGCLGDTDCCDTHYCYSGGCVAKKDNGQTCGGGNECVSGFCVDGYCCDTACDQGCESCSINAGTCTLRAAGTDPENDCPVCTVCSGTDNSCVLAAVGTDPAEDCAATAATTCGLDGLCDGAGACRKWISGTTCVDQYCVGGVTYSADTCNGSGTCTDNGTVDCAGYVCDGIACRTTCSEDSHCSSTFYCASGSCVPKKANGQTCGAGNECSSTFCVDGYCCNNACDGTCQACNRAGSLGTCTNVPNDTDPENECGFCGVCTGGGACKAATSGTDVKNNCTTQPQTGCGYDGHCDGNYACRYWNPSTVCVAQFCSGDRLYYEDLCSGAGQCVDAGSISCSPYKCSGTTTCKTTCIDDNDCFTGHYCTGGFCVAKKTNGSTCTAANQCSSGYCVDGYCCNNACNGACRACNVSGQLGTCTNHGSGLDPEAECGLCKTCNGSGACANAAEGTDPKNQCAPTAPSTCGLDGECNGKGACRHWAGGTVCLAQSCAGDVLAPTDYCDGAGTCIGSSSSCSTLGWSDAGGSQWVCGNTEPCSGLVSYPQAQQICSTRGGRLCTWSEIEAGEVAGLGSCGYDNQRVWSLSECGEDQHYTGAGAPANLGSVPRQCTADAGTAYVACCSDDFSCCPYKCSGSGCGTTCGSNDDCCDGFFCDGSACIQTKPAGQTCQFNFQCASGYCVDGYCCNEACDGSCESCALVGHIGTCWPHAANLDPDNDCPTCWACDGNGACSKVAAGSDPTNDCATDNITSCDQDGACDGNGACRLYGLTAICVAATCEGSTFYNADTCNGSGSCSDKGSYSCCPYMCSTTGAACRPNCSLDTHCCSDAYCSTGACVPKKANGQVCSGGNQCTSGNCVDGVCCNTTCVGSCRSCAVSGSVGTCTNYGNGLDPEAECGLCKVCNGGGSCTNVGAGLDPKNNCTGTSTSSCGFDGNCNGSGACAFWPSTTMCVAESCTGSTYYKPDYCSGSGLCSDAGTVNCCPYKCGATTCRTTCGDDTNCCDTAYCSGTTCTAKKAQGNSCTRDGECSSGFCVDGYCCNTRCDGECKSCGLAGLLGTCSNIAANTDPVNECGTCRVCNGSGACAFVPNNQDPLDECSTQAPCGQDGVCNGAGACRKYASGYACSTQTCTGETKYLVDTCNGTGTCNDAGTVSCCPYKCGTTDCKTSCSTSVDCCSTHYCSGSACVSKKSNGQACGAGGECQSGYCVDGVCCNSACSSSCESCAISGSVGTCTKHPVGRDPDNECGLCRVCNSSYVCAAATNGTDPESECSVNGCLADGMCDGSGACRKTASGTVCLAASCSGGTYYRPDECDGVGNCVDKGTQNCSPYYCVGSACGTNCSTDSNCVAGYYCSASSCVAKKGLGVSCSGNNQCSSGYCIDGVCCNNACTGTCRACDIAGTLGTCTYVANNQDIDTECGKCNVCNGAGACKFALPGQDPKNECTEQTPCAQDGSCDGAGNCRLWGGSTVCTAQTCPAGGSTLHLTDYCSGTGTCTDSGTSSCCPFMCGTNACKTSCTVGTQAADCCSTAYCNGSTCANKKAQGATCAAAYECSSGYCVDGVCCAGACNGTCQSCNQAGYLGTCRAIANGQDPQNECGFCRTCNGASACTNVPAGADPKSNCDVGATACGQTGYCNGSAACQLQPTSTVCVAQSCSGTTLYLADKCNGSGACADSGTQSCVPYVCSGSSCGTSCTGDANCATGYYCSSGACIAKKSNGTACTAGNQCLSSYCVDGYCCNTSCTGNCQQCNKSGAVGTCSYSSVNTDPDNNCGLCGMCDGSGTCTYVPVNQDYMNECAASATTSCGNTGNCTGNSYACAKWPYGTLCGSQSCSGSTFQPANICNGSGSCVTQSSYTCCPYLCSGSSCLGSCSSDSHCCANNICRRNGTACVGCTTTSPCPTGSTYCCGGICTNPIVLAPGADGVAKSYVGTTYGLSGSSHSFVVGSTTYGAAEPERVFRFNMASDEGARVVVRLVYQSYSWSPALIIRQDSCTGGILASTTSCSTSSGCSVQFYAEKNRNYYIIVDGTGGTKGDFTISTTNYRLCGDCSCSGAAYGETVDSVTWKQSSASISTEYAGVNAVDCRYARDFAGNASNLNLYSSCASGNRCHKAVMSDWSGTAASLGGARDDWRTTGGYSKVNCPTVAGTSAYQDGVDHFYSFQLTSASYVWVRLEKSGTWTSGRAPRLHVVTGTARDKISTGKLVCTDGNGTIADYGAYPSSWTPSAGTYYNMYLGAGWYFIVVDQSSGSFSNSHPTEGTAYYVLDVYIFPGI